MYKNQLKWTSWLNLLFLIFEVVPGWSQQTHVAALEVSRVVPMAMGGAYSSVEDGIGSVTYNPATVAFWHLNHGFRFALVANPVGSVALYSYLNSKEKASLNQEQWWNVARALLKGFVLGLPYFQGGVLLYEEPLGGYENLPENKGLSAEGLLDNHYETAFGRLNLADRVSLGGTISLYTYLEGDSAKRTVGASYGVLLKPSRKLNVGVMFYDVPDTIGGIRLPIERLPGGTVNVGISYRPFKGNVTSLDVRNLTEEAKPATREVHFGVEQKFGSFLGVRAGFFQNNDTRQKYFSAGIGLVSANLFRANSIAFDNPDFMLNYAYVVERSKSKWGDQWHLVSLLLYF